MTCLAKSCDFFCQSTRPSAAHAGISTARRCGCTLAQETCTELLWDRVFVSLRERAITFIEAVVMPLWHLWLSLLTGEVWKLGQSRPSLSIFDPVMSFKLHRGTSYHRNQEKETSDHPQITPQLARLWQVNRDLPPKHENTQNHIRSRKQFTCVHMIHASPSNQDFLPVTCA